MNPHPLAASRFFTGPLCLFDLVLGTLAVFFPQFYMAMFQPAADSDPVYLLMRTGVLWLEFSVFEGLAFVWFRQFPELVLIVSIMRLDDVPADLVYYLTDHTLGGFGKFALLSAPAFNTVAGACLLYWYLRYRKTRMQNS